MKKRIILLLFLLTFIFFHVSLLAHTRDTLWFDSSSGNYVIQYIGENDTLVTVFFEPATKVDPAVNATVKRSGRINTLFYQYSIKNQLDSKQRLQYFEMEYQIDFIDSTHNRWELHKISIPILQANEIKYVDAMRFFWAGGIGLAPGVSAEGFKLISKGLPGIANAYFQGRAAEFFVLSGGPSYEIDQQLAKLQLFPANRVIRKTIGPVLPPSPFVSLVFLDTLISYKHQAFALGWLKDKKEDRKDEHDEDTDETIVKNLDKRLEKVRRELVKGDSAKAREELQKFVKKIEKLWKESAEAVKEKKEDKVMITSEAYALLKFNAEYLIDRLPKKKEKDDDD